MRIRIILRALVIVAVAVGLVAVDAAAIGVKDIKKKVEKKAKEEADKAKGEAPETSETPETPAASEGEDTPGESSADQEGGGAGGGSVSTVSTKFDFVPGDKIRLLDDFTRDELGEFPSRWKLVTGNFDIAEFQGARWLRLNGDDGIVAIKNESLPEKWTLEFDMHQEKMLGMAFTVGGLPPGNDTFSWETRFGNGGSDVTFEGPDGLHSTASAPNGLDGRRHVSVMGNGTSVKVYVDRERLANIPEMTFGEGQVPSTIGFRLWDQGGSDPMITNVRFAEGGKPKVDLMTTPFVTHGITFDSGSDRLRPESAAVLRQVAAYLKENPAVKVKITGHTDDVGETAANQTLSEKRAASVAASLTADFGIEAGRMSAAGKGESAPMAPNETPEGKAMNRRVEFSKN